jgi:hypothetical protein
MFVVSLGPVMVGGPPRCYDGLLMKLRGICGELTVIFAPVRGVI